MAIEARHKRSAWMLAVLLFAGSVLNYVDRSVLGVLMPQIRRDLSLTNEQYGLAVNSFLMLYAVFYVLGGKFADRLGYRLTVFWSVLFWSVANALHVFATGLRSLCFYRALLGMGEGVFYPAAIRCIAEWFPPANRAKAVGLLLSGLSAGTLLTPPVAAWILVHYGWRAAFVATGVSGLVLLPPWILAHRAPRPMNHRWDPERSTGAGVPLRAALKERNYWCVLAARAASDAAWYFYLFWMPGYFQEVRRFDPAMVGKYLWIPYFCAGAGALTGAWASSALIRRWNLSPERSRKTVLIPSAACAALGALACLAADPAVALLLASVALFSHQSWSSNLHTVITEISPPEHVSVLYGITGAAGTLAGALSQPLIGRVVDFRGYDPAFAAAGAAYLVAIALLVAAGRLRKPSPAPGA